MRYLILLLIFIFTTAISSCRKNFSTVPSFGQLEFSKDTVFLDTIFTNISSATYSLKVYNRSDKDITIPEIRLKNGATSKYRLSIDGITKKPFQNIDILAKDSLYIFIETTVDINTIVNPLYTDKILFDNGTKQQLVNLVTLIKDAIFIYPNRNSKALNIDKLLFDGKSTVQGRFLSDKELSFTKDKPYVIYGYATVPANKTLTIQAGTNIYFHANSGLIIDKNATLNIIGNIKEKVTLQGDRLGHSFRNTPGQWGAIWLRAGSKNNTVEHTKIKNGTIGFLVDSIGSNASPTLKITDTEIYNSSAFGMLGRNASIEGNNLVIGNSGQSSFAGTLGGIYNFIHSTFANYWSNGVRQLPAVLIKNFVVHKNNNGQQVTYIRDLQQANFTNCIVEGNNPVELIIDNIKKGEFNYNFKNCMIHFQDITNSYTNNAELNFKNTKHYQNIILNGNPDFKNTAKNNFGIGRNSSAINKATASGSQIVTFDILGFNRTKKPDIGAYQHAK